MTEVVRQFLYPKMGEVSKLDVFLFLKRVGKEQLLLAKGQRDYSVWITKFSKILK